MCLVTVTIFLITLTWLYKTRIKPKIQNWKSLGIKGTPFSILGNNPEFCLENAWYMKKNLGDISRELCLKFPDEKCFGTYGISGSRILMVQDPELIKIICVKEFNSFMDRSGNFFDGLFNSGTLTDTIYENQLVFLKGEKWKNIRSTFSPIFTGGKMKSMLGLMNEICQQLTHTLEQDLKNGIKKVELMDRFGRATMDNFASCILGVHSGSLDEWRTQNEFLRRILPMFHKKKIDAVSFLCLNIPGFHHFMRIFDKPFFRKDGTLFLYEIIKETLELRKKKTSSEKRNDMVDVILEMLELNPENELIYISTALVCLLAGYDTTKSTLTLATYELAKNQEIQESLLEEIDNLEQEISYHTLQNECHLLDWIIYETLRLYPAFTTFTRACTKDYQIPDTNYIVKKGEEIHFPSFGIHHNPNNFSNPLKWDPYRFKDPEHHPYAFVGFGIGPRNCFGKRFAVMELKLILINFFRNFKVDLCEETPKNIKLDPTAVLAMPYEDVIVQITSRNKN